MIKALMLVPLTLLIYLPGLATFLVLFARTRVGGGIPDPLEALFGELAIGLSVGGGLALILALTGVFSLMSWTGCVLAYSAVFFVFAHPSLKDLQECFPISLKLITENLYLVLILALALALFLLPFMNVFGQQDDGVYPNIASNIRRTGSVFATDTLMREMNPDVYKLFYYTSEETRSSWRNMQEPGFYVDDFKYGTITPQFVFFYPALMAVFMAFLGARGGFLVVPLMALLSVWALYLIGVRLFEKKAALLAALLMSVNFLEVYFAKWSGVEMAVQFFFLMGLLAYLRYQDSLEMEHSGRARWAWGIIAGLGFTCMMLSHLASLLFLAPLFLVALYRFVEGGLKALGARYHFAAVMAPGALVAAGLELAFSRRYSLLTLREALQNRWGTLVIVFCALLAVSLLLRCPMNGVYRYLLSRKRAVMYLVSLALALLVVFAWFINPLINSGGNRPAGYREFQASMLSRLAFYITPLVLALAVVGYCLFLTRKLDGKNLLVPLSGLFFGTLFTYQIFAGQVVPYSLRRFIPMAFPIALLMAAFAVIELSSMLKGKATRAREVASVALAVLAAATVIWCFTQSLHVTKIGNTASSYPVIHEISDLARKPAVIICDAKATHLLAAPLRYFFGRQVGGLRDSESVDLPEFSSFLTEIKKRATGAYLVAEDSAIPDEHQLLLEKKGVVVFGGEGWAQTKDRPSFRVTPMQVSFTVYEIVL